MSNKISIFWFRRDLRIHDNVGLFHALSGSAPVIPIFIFDTNILSKLSDTADRRVDYIHHSLTVLNQEFCLHGSALHTYHGRPLDIIGQLTSTYSVDTVYCNRDYEPEAIARDAEIAELLAKLDIPYVACKDQVLFDTNDVVKSNGMPYTVYTPYSRMWKSKVDEELLQPRIPNCANLARCNDTEIHTLSQLGFKETDIPKAKPSIDAAVIATYHLYRDYPAMQKTSGLGIALRMGTISVRSCIAFALRHNSTWLNELIWREFFMQILYHFPRVVNEPFNYKYNRIRWRNNEKEFDSWCTGTTGYPIVDAGIRQLNATGYMHNRVRMIVASFLCKHLLVDWRWGEAYFAQKLNDYDLSANNGNWQWAAGSGCDAAPYFRIFNPITQAERFDSDMKYITSWLPEYGTDSYPQPIVEHRFARARALQAYKEAFDSVAYE